MARLTPPQMAGIVLGAYLLGAGALALMVFEALHGRWSICFFGAGCVLGFVLGLRVGLSAEEPPSEAPLRLGELRSPGRLPEDPQSRPLPL